LLALLCGPVPARCGRFSSEGQMTHAEVSLESLRQFTGRRQESTDVVPAGPANLLRLTFARDEPEFKEGDALPPGWQILYFLPRYRPEELRPDGSPRDSGVG